MFYAVELYLDPAFDDAIGQLRREIDERLGCSAPHGRPHLTLGAGGDGRVSQEAGPFRAIGETVAGRPVVFSSIGLFPGVRSVLFFAPVVTDSLLALHREVDDRLRELSPELANLYRPGRWVPHCTLVAELTCGELATAVEIATAFPLPATTQISSIDVRRYPPEPDPATRG